MSETTLPREIKDCPPSCKLVYYALDDHGELTQGDISEITRLPPRTVRYALERLIDGEETVTVRPNMADARQKLYQTSK
ncbi:MarR family transcriptional regulator [Halalkalicoccus jeotgali]|nr:helix-turn-helix domain-containing protein [Halalkalicoccus jeotgali]ELY40091.1 ArsR family transcriptional regulator [Halalkalicoccus jeotgali B3]